MDTQVLTVISNVVLLVFYVILFRKLNRLLNRAEKKATPDTPSDMWADRHKLIADRMKDIELKCKQEELINEVKKELEKKPFEQWLAAERLAPKYGLIVEYADGRQFVSGAIEPIIVPGNITDGTSRSRAKRLAERFVNSRSFLAAAGLYIPWSEDVRAVRIVEAKGI